jgi:hypothetical protein
MVEVLELGVVVHSLIIGMSLGASDFPSTVRPLVPALTFHQFFEGIGLGGCIVQVIYPHIYSALTIVNFNLFFFFFFFRERERERFQRFWCSYPINPSCLLTRPKIPISNKRTTDVLYYQKVRKRRSDFADLQMGLSTLRGPVVKSRLKSHPILLPWAAGPPLINLNQK